MIPKTLYRYPRQRERQDTSYNLVTELGFQKDGVYLTFVHHLMKKGKKSTAENLFRKTLNIIEQKTKYSENAFAVLNRFQRLWIKKRKKQLLFVFLFK
jgi:ribosomal protein S7